MVKLTGKRYGVDLSADRIRIAGRTYSAGRTMVNTIVDLDPGEFEKDMIDRSGDFYFSVSEKDAIIKRIVIPPEGNLDPGKMVQFEMLSSLLDGEDRYYMETYDLDLDSRMLAIAYNRTLINQKITYLEEIITKPSGFRLRSLAMASAYINYCHRDGGKLVCLVDISEKHGSYCFLRDDSPVLIGGIENGTMVESKSADLSERFIVDLAAVLQYKLSEISAEGCSIPLSLIIITGCLADSEIASKIENNVQVKTRLPRLRRELFSEDIFSGAEKYLVSLGLTVDR